VKGHLEAVLDGISESIVVLDRKYRIINCNSAFQKWVDKPKSTLGGLSCFAVIHGYAKPCRKCVIREVFSKGRPAESIHHHQTKSGRVFHEIRAYPIFREGKITEAVYVFRDVSERESMKERLKANYEQLLKANAELMKLDMMKTEFLSIASHELRTPLAVIKGYAEILASGGLGLVGPEQKAKLERITSNADHLDMLVNNILDLTRMDAGELKLEKRRFQAKTLIRNVLADMAQLASKKSIRLSLKVEDGLKLTADRTRMRQVLVNLVDNAVKFTPEGGQVKVTASKKDGAAVIRVSDTGVGVREKDQRLLFTRFYQADSSIQRRYRGTGLGLTICKRIVELHGGQIRFESRYRKGATVTIVL